MATITELQQRMEECEAQSRDWECQHSLAYEAEAQYLESILCELGEDEEYEYDEYGWTYWLEGMLEDVMDSVYEDWFASEENIFLDPVRKGKWKEGTSGYQWMVWALNSEVVAFHDHMVEWCEENDRELPQWYKEEWLGEED